MTIVTVGLLLMLYLFIRIITRELSPLRRLAREAETIASGQFDTQLPNLERVDEIGQLSQSFGNMQQSLVRYIEELKDTTAQKASIESELNVANSIQMSMLPRFMAQVTRLFRTLANQQLTPADICTHMNEALSGDENPTNMFVTLFIGMFDLKSGHLSFCNAGHNPPVIGGGANHGDFLEMKPNFPIGVLPGLEFEGEEIADIHGRALFIYTDGLNEAESRWC